MVVSWAVRNVDLVTVAWVQTAAIVIAFVIWLLIKIKKKNKK